MANSAKVKTSCRVIIQARMGSTRFPGKSMFELKGRCSLGHLVDSLRKGLESEKLLIVTSELSENNPIRDFSSRESIEFFSGDEENVALRFAKVLKFTDDEYFVRISGDSPLFDYRPVLETLNGLDPESDEIVTSIYPERTMPSGVNFEFVRRDVFLREYQNFTEERHFEHVTPYFYENAENFKIRQAPVSIENPSKYKFSFDTPEDRIRVEAIFEAMDKPHWLYTLKEKCAIYERLFGNEDL